MRLQTGSCATRGSDIPTTPRPIAWFDHGNHVWARILGLECGAARDVLAMLRASTVEHHRPHLDTVATLTSNSPEWRVSRRSRTHRPRVE